MSSRLREETVSGKNEQSIHLPNAMRGQGKGQRRKAEGDPDVGPVGKGGNATLGKPRAEQGPVCGGRRVGVGMT